MPGPSLKNRALLNRREAMLLSATAGMRLAMSKQASASGGVETGVHQQQPGNCSTPRTAVANTQYGKVRGFVDGGVFTFKGIPYGQNTGGENRWLPAKPPVPWKDEYPALIYGANCPQSLHNYRAIEQSFLQDWDDGYMSEDMLKLNIWTPSLTGQRPVMFYIHGGIFQFGSSYELPSHEGAQMARHHDVVQVSVNHRLNALGFLDVSEIGGDGYEDSVNVGMTDLVAALRWVQENISNFGGDPNKVMIYGQSGGASKVTTLLGMPSAKGLIHRASVQSGGGGNYPSGEESREFARQIVKELGIAPNDIGALQKMDWSRLYAAGNKVAAKGSAAAMGGASLLFVTSGIGKEQHFGWTPTVDGRVITTRAFSDGAPEISKDVPMLMGSVSEENMQFSFNPDEAQWLSTLGGAVGEDKAARLLAAMKKTYPEKSVRQLFYRLGGLGGRNHVQQIAKMKYDLHAAPVYQYYFTWQTPMLDAVGGAWHTAELAFCFDNTKRCEQGTGNTPEAQALAKKMATAWSNFARTGNPSQPGLTWDPAEPGRGQTMVWDNECSMVDDPESELRKILLN